MKLYYAPGACSMSPHIVLRELQANFELEKVNLAQHKTASGEDYSQLNSKGYVPALKLDDGQVLTEASIIIQYLADQKPETGLIPKAGSMERYRLMEWLNFISSEVHKQFGPLFNPKSTQETKAMQLAALQRRFKYLAEALNDKPYLLGEHYTVADAYLFNILSWTNFLKISLDDWPVLKDYLKRIAIRPAVQAAMQAEGLLK